MDFLNEIADYLDSEGVGTVGTDLFVGSLPPDPDDCVAVLGLTSNPIGVQRDVADLQFPRFQVITRNTDYEGASAALQAVRGALHGILSLNLPVGVNITTQQYIRLLRCHADQEGGPIGSDDQGRYEFSINFSAEYHYVPAPE